MKLNIGWLYPQHMSTYGDHGNIICLEKRCMWRNIDVEILYLDLGFDIKKLYTCDLLFMGGAQDKQQKIVSKDLNKKAKDLTKIIESGVPGLYICGAYQFLGNYYKEASGTKIKGLRIFDLYTESFKDKTRFIGNIAVKPNIEISTLIGFENHGGRTYLGQKIEPFGTVLKGFGNNAGDKTEGGVYKESFGTYLHGPILPKNPELADYLITKALEKKYKEKIKLAKLENSLEEKARSVIAKRLQITI